MELAIQAGLLSIPIIGSVVWYSQQITELSVKVARTQDDVVHVVAKVDKIDDTQRSFELTTTQKLGEVGTTAKGIETNLDLLRRSLKQ